MLLCAHKSIVSTVSTKQYRNCQRAVNIHAAVSAHLLRSITQHKSLAPTRLGNEIQLFQLDDGIYSIKCNDKTNKIRRPEKQSVYRHNLAVLSWLPVARYGADG
jgi:hypothetical protein